MADKTTYFVLKEKAVPEVLLKETSGFREMRFRAGGRGCNRNQPKFLLQI